MEKDLASELIATYQGNLVHSKSSKVFNTEVQVTRLNNLLVKVTFNFEKHDFIFRAMLSEQEEGILMLIQDRVFKSYILTGISGFLYQKPNVHGGLIRRMNSFYFHVTVDLFDGTSQEIYFLGKEQSEYENIQAERAQRFQTAS